MCVCESACVRARGCVCAWVCASTVLHKVYTIEGCVEVWSNWKKVKSVSFTSLCIHKRVSYYKTVHFTMRVHVILSGIERGRERNYLQHIGDRTWEDVYIYLGYSLNVQHCDHGKICVLLTKNTVHAISNYMELFCHLQLLNNVYTVSNVYNFTTGINKSPSQGAYTTENNKGVENG